MPDGAVNQYQRAFRAWPILITTAANRSTITYAELADYLQIHPRPIRYVLSVIQDWCLQEHKPPLTILVVNQHGRPGHGFIAWDLSNLGEGYEQVYSFPWATLANPFVFAREGVTLGELVRQLVMKPDDTVLVYRRVKDRGISQVVFRDALMIAYGEQCAFCGLSLKPALQAAHIIPWGLASPEQRVSASNGLLLCSTHHDLFDANVLSVTTDRKICFLRDKIRGHRWTDADRAAAVVLDGQPIAIPTDPQLRPSDVALAYRTARVKGLTVSPLGSTP